MVVIVVILSWWFWGNFWLSSILMWLSKQTNLENGPSNAQKVRKMFVYRILLQIPITLEEQWWKNAHFLCGVCLRVGTSWRFTSASCDNNNMFVWHFPSCIEGFTGEWLRNIHRTRFHTFKRLAEVIAPKTAVLLFCVLITQNNCK